MKILESQDTSTTLESTQRKRSGKRTSRCWESFDLIPRTSDGKNCAKCKKGGKELYYSSTSGTFSYDRFCELVIEGVVKHDLPFNFIEYEGIRAIFDYVSPELCLPSRNTDKNHIIRLYEIEKSKMQVNLSKAKGSICLTSYIWSSHTSDGYLSLTTHFIDSEWKLQKRLLNFCHMPPLHTGSALAEKINTLICKWKIDTNLLSITLDNASANNSCVDMLKTQLNLRRLLLLNGQFFRCCAHIINLIVQDSLKVIDDSVVKVRDSIKYIKGLMARKHRFFEYAQQVGLTKNRRALRQDVPIRWNSTYHMLDSALYYHQAFGQYVLAEPDFETCPTSEEWDHIKTISKFLVDFYELVTFKNTLDSLYEPYVLRWSTESSSREQIYEARPSSQEADELFQDFNSSCIKGTSVKNELTSYLEDKNLERKMEIDVLYWWKKMQSKYHVLSRLASDILSIHVSTVASESAFSIGGRVIDQYRSSLLPKTVEALLCLRDWLFEKKCEDSSFMDILAEDVLNLNISPRNELA